MPPRAPEIFGQFPNSTGSFRSDNLGYLRMCVLTDGDAFYSSDPYPRNKIFGENSTEQQNSLVNFDLSRSSTLFGASDTVQPKTLRAYFLIRYAA